MEESEPSGTPEAPRRPAWRRFLPLLLLVAALILVFATGAQHYLSFTTLRDHRAELQDLVARHAILAALLFILVYALAVALSVPGAIVLTMTSGFLFGTLWGAFCAVIGATAGATLLYLVARSAFGHSLRRRAGGVVRRLEAGFRDNALSYLLVLRLVPVVPFWIVNLAAAVLEVPLRTYLLGTFLGIIPGAFVYAQVGAGLGSVFDAGGRPTLAGVLTPQVLLALGGLAVLALVPVVYKQLRRRGKVPAAERPPG